MSDMKERKLAQARTVLKWTLLPCAVLAFFGYWIAPAAWVGGALAVLAESD